MKIVFWGTPKYAAVNLRHLVKAGYQIIAVVTQPDRKRGRGKNLSPSPVKQAALEFGIPVHTTQSIRDDHNTKNLLNNLKADVYIVVAFGQILPKEILDQPKLGCWNSHASLLPKWRGAAPIQWSIINEDVKTGVCIISMEEGLDTGPVIEQESTEITDSDNLQILSNRLSNISSKLLVKSLERLSLTKGLTNAERLKKLNAINQSNIKGNASYARIITKEDYLINWNQNAKTLINKINGLYPNAYTLYNGKRIKILESSLLLEKYKSLDNNKIDHRSTTEYSPGQIININQKIGLIAMTNDYPIIIRYGQLEGKNKSDGYTLSVQSNLKVNNILGN